MSVPSITKQSQLERLFKLPYPWPASNHTKVSNKALRALTCTGLQVAERVRTSKQVTILERTNLRHLRLSDLPQSKLVEFVTLDLSFISLLTVIGPVCSLMTTDAGLVVLIKPQFEAAKQQVRRESSLKGSYKL